MNIPTYPNLHYSIPVWKSIFISVLTIGLCVSLCHPLILGQSGDYIEQRILGEMPVATPVGKNVFEIFETAPATLPCNGAGDDISIEMCPQEFLNFFLWTVIPNSTPGGYWLPPLDPYYGAPFTPCIHGEGTYYYVVSEPGCPNDTAAVTVDLTTWDPCGWSELIFAQCVGIGDPNNECDDTIQVTVPPIPGYHDGTTYSLIVYNGILISGTGNYEETSTFLITSFDPTLGYCCPIINIVDDNTQCEAFYYIQEQCIGVEPCSCMDPPNAGENNEIRICFDDPPFNLTDSLGTNVSQNGTWNPPLNGGGNILIPSEFGGWGTFTYTVSEPGCPDDVATIVVDVVQLEYLIPSISCWHFYTPDPLDDAFVVLIEMPILFPSGSGNAYISNDPNANFGACYCWTTWESEYYPISGAPPQVTVTVTDVENPSCSIIWTLDVPPACSDNILCPGAGTGSSVFPCETTPPWNLTESISQPGANGFWVPPLSSGGNVYSPLLDGSGEFYYVVLQAGCPDDTATVIVNVQSLIDIVITGIPDTMCDLDPFIILPTNQQGITGNWAGTGVTSNRFYPENLAGPIDITFTPNPDECANLATTQIYVEPSVIPVVINVPDTVCQTDPPIPLPSTLDGITGTWSGSGVNNNTFTPPNFNGSIPITFTPNPGECAHVVSTSIYIESASTPTITGVPALLCNSSVPVALNPVQDGVAGNWSGPGVINNLFSPTGLSGTITLTFTPEINQCALAAMISIQVLPDVFIVIQGVADTLCEFNAPMALPDIQSGVSGEWSGEGVSNNVFVPTGLSGNIPLLFTPEAGQCANPAIAIITIQAAVTPQLDNLPDTLCQTSSPLSLSSNQNGIPGNWTGTGIVNNIFDPSGLQGSIIITFVPEPGTCAASVPALIQVASLLTPQISGIPDTLCQHATPIILPTSFNSITGTWSGPGVSDSIFSPAGLSGNMLLLFTPLYTQCTTTGSAVVQVNTAPSFTSLVATCDSLTDTYSVSFDIAGGIPGTYTINNIPIPGASYTSPPISNDSIQYQFIIHDQGGCGPILLKGTKNCACATDAGTMDFSISPLRICITSSIQVFHLGDHQLDNDDLLAFVIHDLPGTQPGNIYAISTSPNFTVPPGIVPGQTYYISSIAGSDDGSGQIDLTDACLSVSPGIPVVFYAPAVNISPGDTICPSDCYTYQLQLQGEKPFTLDYLLMINGNPLLQSLQADTTSVSITICPDVYGVAAGEITIADFTLTDAQCSINYPDPAHTTVTVMPTTFALIEATLCPGESMVVHNQIYDQSNPAGTEILPNAGTNGCDSIIEVNLLFHGESIHILNQTLCYGSSLLINGTLYDETNPSGTEIMANAASTGCDSTIYIQLTFDSIVSTALSQTLCPGEAITVNGVTYDEQNPTGQQLFVQGSVSGCDSLVYIDLTFFPHPMLEIKDTLCFGESLTINGQVYDAQHPTGTESVSTLPCDSTIVIALQFHPESFTIIRDTLNPDEGIWVNGVYYDIQSPTGTEIIANGSYLGCDSTIYVDLLFRNAVLVAEYEVIQPVCEGDAGLLILQTLSGGMGTYYVQVDTAPPFLVDQFPFVIEEYVTGIHQFSVTDTAGLLNTLNHLFEINEPLSVSVDAGPDQVIPNGQDVFIIAEASPDQVTWQWWPPDFLSCTQCSNPIVLEPNRDLLYMVTVTDVNGCTASDDLFILVKQNNEIFFPNVFSPNGDGINDLAFINSSSVELVKYMRIYTRWGDLIYEKMNFPANDSRFGWDGKFHDETLNPGVYVWVIDVKFEDGTEKLISGDVTLLR